jgi:hypothetical protein
VEPLRNDVIFIEADSKLVKYDGTLARSDRIENAGRNTHYDKEGDDPQDDVRQKFAIIHIVFGFGENTYFTTALSMYLLITHRQNYDNLDHTDLS